MNFYLKSVLKIKAISVLLLMYYADSLFSQEKGSNEFFHAKIKRKADDNKSHKY